MKTTCGIFRGSLFLLFGLLVFFNGIKHLNAYKNIGISNYTLPDDFILGVSTAAYQIEGAWKEAGKGENEWDAYLHKHPNFTVDHSNADIAADFYHKYKDDIAMVRSLGLDYFRMSISWSRLLPKGNLQLINKDGVKFYRNVFENLRKANISVIVTLYHWDLPNPLLDFGGWNNPQIVDYFEDYARIAFKLFGDQVKMWITINEPHQQCGFGYGGDLFVPVINQTGVGVYMCSHHMLLAHAKAYHLYDKVFRPYQKGKIGLALDSYWIEPKDPTKQEDIDAAERHTQMHFGIYAHPIFSKHGDYPKIVRERVDKKSSEQGFKKSRLPYFTKEEVLMLKGSADFLGLNHYTAYLGSSVSHQKDWPIPSLDDDTGVLREQDPNWPIPGVSWQAVYPPGFRKLLNWITKEYETKYPIIVTENGASDYGELADYDRVSYFNEYINQMLLAMYEDGCNVIGYFAWSLMDSFEWNDGYTLKFGLYRVDFKDKQKTRTPKLSAFNYREIARTRRVNFDFIKLPE